MRIARKTIRGQGNTTVIPQIFQHFPATLIAALGFFHQRLHDHRADTRVNGRIQLLRRHRVFIHDFINNGGNALTGEWFFAGHHLIQHHAQGKNIAASIDGPALHLFRRHITGRAHYVRGLLHGAKLQDLRGTEVCDLHSIVGGQHKVGRLDVAMYHMTFVRELQRAARLLRYAQYARQ